jgi:hypothetical protein
MDALEIGAVRALVICCARVQVEPTGAEPISEASVFVSSRLLALKEHGSSCQIVILKLRILQLHENLRKLFIRNVRASTQVMST